MIDVKICTICKKEFPATLEYFHSEKRNKNGLRGCCRICKRENDKQYRINQYENRVKNRRDFRRRFKEKYGCNYNALHKWINSHKTKTGICMICNEKKETVWSNIDHSYRKDLEDWKELCFQCHEIYDRNINNKNRGDSNE